MNEGAQASEVEQSFARFCDHRKGAYARPVRRDAAQSMIDGNSVYSRTETGQLCEPGHVRLNPYLSEVVTVVQIDNVDVTACARHCSLECHDIADLLAFPRQIDDRGIICCVGSE
ncbi:hypothetical protein PspCFBP13508_18930 [Pseudomonas sp. CFBP13508]|nr:hypothetical protein PspCFBP13508_18930 [Pseudomonas sp. CFBP13508]